MSGESEVTRIELCRARIFVPWFTHRNSFASLTAASAGWKLEAPVRSFAFQAVNPMPKGFFARAISRQRGRQALVEYAREQEYTEIERRIEPPPTSSKPATDTRCPRCKCILSIKNIARHLRRVHGLNSTILAAKRKNKVGQEI